MIRWTSSGSSFSAIEVNPAVGEQHRDHASLAFEGASAGEDLRGEMLRRVRPLCLGDRRRLFRPEPMAASSAEAGAGSQGTPAGRTLCRKIRSALLAEAVFRGILSGADRTAHEPPPYHG
jgi:hypothetical protein